MERRTAYRAADLPLGIMHMHPQEALQLHRHDFIELVVILRGSGTHVLANRRAWALQPGDVFVIPAELRHGYRHCRDLHLVNVMIDHRWLAGSGLQSVPGFTAFCNLEPLLRSQHDFSSHLQLDQEQYRGISTQIEQLTAAFSLATPARNLAIRARLELLLLELAGYYAAAGTHLGDSLLRLESALRLIDEGMSHQLSLDDLATAAHVSVSTLGRLFHDCFGRSPGDYLIERRLERAKRLLHDSDLGIKDIAQRVGIPDANYFSRLFKQRLGRTPRTWRRSTKN